MIIDWGMNILDIKQRIGLMNELILGRLIDGLFILLMDLVLDGEFINFKE